LSRASVDLNALGDVADIALDDLLAARFIDVADEFHLDQPPVFCSERQIFIADIFIFLQVLEGMLAGFDILECTHFPDFFFYELFSRIFQHIDQERIDIGDRSALGIQDQNPVLGRLKQTPVAKL